MAFLAALPEVAEAAGASGGAEAGSAEAGSSGSGGGGMISRLLEFGKGRLGGGGQENQNNEAAPPALDTDTLMEDTTARMRATQQGL